MRADANGIDGRIALVTGASRGLGLEIARALANEGADVALGYLSRRQEAEELVASTYGVRVIAVGGDVSKAGDVEEMVSAVESQLGDVGILVNNAGINPSATLDSITQATWDQTLATNLTSAFLVTQRVLPGMRKAQFGRLIMMSSVAAQLGGVIGPHYSASKAGLLGLMHSYASLLAKEGITANAIAPALIDTDMIKDNPNITSALLPVKRFGRPREVADIAVALARIGYITGQTINVNGGWYQS
jgi:3-oxoacyl-[acyl-carrier protein] reductase